MLKYVCYATICVKKGREKIHVCTQIYIYTYIVDS